jgi:hypothetical protein
LAQHLSEVQLSALYSCIPDCIELFHDIYYRILPALREIAPSDYENLGEEISNLGGLASTLAHIKEHLAEAEEGFAVLLRLIDDASERGAGQR